jgi:hypothetical protein
MSYQSKVVVNNVEKGQRDNLLKVRGKDRPFADIRIPVSYDDRGGGSTIRGHSSTQWHASRPAWHSSATRLVNAAKQSVIGCSVRLFLIAGGNIILLTHGGWSCMSRRIYLCWAPFQQLLKVALMYSSLCLHHTGL